jgi:hypothetical protein
MDMPLQFRQGDVLIILCDRLPESSHLMPREADRVVLAHGEVTGHAHAIAEPDVEMYEKEGHYFIRVPRAAVVQHEEHSPIALEAGTYRIVRQREYVPGEPSLPMVYSPTWEPNLPQTTMRGWYRFVAD